MIIDKSLMNIVKKSSSKFLLKNFKKVIEQLNFDDDMSGDFSHDKNIWIEVKFDNSWVLTVWNDDKYSMHIPNGEPGPGETWIFSESYEKLLCFMKKNGIRKPEQCEYKDAEIYIVDF